MDSILRQKELQPSSYPRDEVTAHSGVYSTLPRKKDSKIPFLGQCPSVQHFYKQLHLEMCESVTLSEK